MEIGVSIFSWSVPIIVAVFVLVTLLGSFFTVQTAEVAIITRFGKFLRAAEA